MTSPVPKSNLLKQSVNKDTILKMTFPEAIVEVMEGEKITRLEWTENKAYGLLRDGFLMIFIDGKLHQWIVSEADLMANDWVVVIDTN